MGEEERRKKKKKKGARRTKAPEIDGARRCVHCPQKSAKREKRPHKPNAAHTGKTWVPGERKKASKRRLN